MYVKKGWYGLPVVLLLLFVTVMSCNQQMGQKNQYEKPENNTQLKQRAFQPSDTIVKNDHRIIHNPHPKVLKAHIGRKDLKHKPNNRFMLHFDTANYQITTEEAISLAEDILNVNKKHNKFEFQDEQKFIWYHKNIRVTKHKVGRLVKTENNYVKSISGIYLPSLDVDTSKIKITPKEAIELAKRNISPIKETGKYCWEYEDFFRKDYNFNKRFINEDLTPKVELHINLDRQQPQLFYNFTLCGGDNNLQPIVSVNAITGKYKNYQVPGKFDVVCNNQCHSCVNADKIEETDCSGHSLTNNQNYVNESQITSTIDLNNFYVPLYYNDQCFSLNTKRITLNTNTEYILYENSDAGQYIEVNGNCMDGIHPCDGYFDPFVSLADNTSFSCVEQSAAQSVYELIRIQDFFSDHFVSKSINNINTTQDYFEILPTVHSLITVNTDNATMWIEEVDDDTDDNDRPYMEIGTGLNNFSYAELEVMAHEYGHYLTTQFFKLKNGGLNNNGESGALLEALSDIYSIYTSRKLNYSDNWSFADAVNNPGNNLSRIPRLLNNPAHVNLGPNDERGTIQADKYLVAWVTNPNFSFPSGISPDDASIWYYKAGVISYWFYLLSKGSNGLDEPINGILLSPNGLGINKAEEILFNALLLLKSKIENSVEGFADGDGFGRINFETFRNTVLEATRGKYITSNTNNVCSHEYSMVYRAFQAVGLIHPDIPSPELLCNVIDYQTGVIAEGCPFIDGEPGTFGCSGGFFNMSYPFYEEENQNYFVVVHRNDGNDNYIFEQSFTVNSDAISNDDMLMFQNMPEPTSSRPLQVSVYNVSNVDVSSPADDYDIPFIRYFFDSCNSCDVIVGEGPPTGNGNVDAYNPSQNQGQINITNSNTFYTCPTSEICIDYTATGLAQTFVNIDSGQFAQLITDITSTSQSGSFCWTPNSNDVGTHSFNITATDGHPTEPITQTTAVTVSVSDYTNDVWANTSPVAVKTNETSAGANNGSVTIGLGSTYTLEYRWVGLGPNGDDLVTYSNWPNGHTQTGLSDGTYTIDVYIQGTDCLYGTYTATVGTNSSGGGTNGCAFDQNLILMRAMPTVFNDQTTIEIELQEQPLQVNLSAQNVFGTASQSLVNGQVLGVGTHQVTFDGSADPNGLYIFQLALVVPQCQKPSA